jgi:hypothetical protein
MHDLSTTTGIVALAAAGAGALALILALVLSVRVHRLRGAQRIVLGERGARDLAGHAADIDREFRSLHSYVEDVAGRLQQRMDAVESRMDGAIAHTALVRYDAYNEMSGHQSSSIALLDARQTGVVLSSILHRDQARLYVKQIREGRAEIDLSPEEAEAVKLALAGAPAVTRTADSAA